MALPTARTTASTRRLRALILAVALVAALGGTAPRSTANPGPAGTPEGMCFPVAGPHRYSNDWGAPRSGGRSHEGNDIMAARHTPQVATVGGTVYWLKTDNSGLSGRALALKAPSDWRYWYIHLNNDNHGTDDGVAALELGILWGLRVGDTVHAGQVISFTGDSGNAETTQPHLHFETHQPGGTPVNPFDHLNAADRGCRPPTGVDVAARPGGGWWSLAGDGRIVAGGGAPHHGEPRFGWDIARAIAVMPDGNGYAVLDGWGGVHRYGSAVNLPPAVAYWSGWDIARDLEIARDGAGFVVLDGWGGVHRAGSAVTALAGVANGAYWSGWDIARDVELTPDGKGYVVLEGWGGLHASGSARGIRGAGAYWYGADIARDLELVGTSTSPGPGGVTGTLVLDSWGGLHRSGSVDASRIVTDWRPGANWVGVDLAADGRWAIQRGDGLARGGR